MSEKQLVSMVQLHFNREMLDTPVPPKKVLGQDAQASRSSRRQGSGKPVPIDLTLKQKMKKKKNVESCIRLDERRHLLSPRSPRLYTKLLIRLPGYLLQGLLRKMDSHPLCRMHQGGRSTIFSMIEYVPSYLQHTMRRYLLELWRTLGFLKCGCSSFCEIQTLTTGFSVPVLPTGSLDSAHAPGKPFFNQGRHHVPLQHALGVRCIFGSEREGMGQRRNERMGKSTAFNERRTRYGIFQQGTSRALMSGIYNVYKVCKPFQGTSTGQGKL